MTTFKPWERFKPNFLNFEYKNPDYIYLIDGGKLVQKAIAGGSKADIHLHSRYSSTYINTPITKIFGVKESYSHPRDIVKKLKAKGMDFFTIQDHNEVLALEELRAATTKESSLEKCFISCEYDVAANELGTQGIHVGVIGIDYAEGSVHPLAVEKVYKIHDSLLKAARKGSDRFLKKVKDYGLIAVFNHPAWIMNPSNPIDGKKLDELVQSFDFLELNMDMQLENIIALELALYHGKTLTSGSDSHNLKRIGSTYVETFEVAETAYDFLEMIRQKKFGINSKLQLPKKTKFYEKDLIRSKFNGSAMTLVNDSYVGIKDYFLYDWSLRKFLVSASFLSSLPTLFLVEAAMFSMLPFVYSWNEKLKSFDRTKRLYFSLQDFYSQKYSDEAKDENEKNKIRSFFEQKKKAFKELKFVQPPTGWAKFVYNLLGKRKFFQPQYDYRINVSQP